jgi:hypothetical protein
VFLRVVNRSQTHLRLHLVSIDRNYYTPLEAAGVNHFSMLKRLSAFGVVGCGLFFPLLALIPSKLISAYRANRRMDEHFQAQAFRLRPVPAGGEAEGFVFTHLDFGTKVVRVCFHAATSPFDLSSLAPAVADPATYRAAPGAVQGQPVVDLTFTIAVPGIAADYLKRDFDALYAGCEFTDCDLPTLVNRLSSMPPATTNGKATRTGDPVNLVVIGEFATILSAFGARWDESETITLRTCLKTARSFVLGSQYRYSPVSPLHLLGRSQDVALQRSRRSINERLHLRLWLTTIRFGGKPVWIGQISRDIGVRFTPKTWNLTTHRIDPDVDESRDYVVEDLMEAERIDAVGYVDGVGACEPTAPRRNLTGDPYFTDGRRAVILLSETRAAPRFVRWS